MAHVRSSGVDQSQTATVAGAYFEDGSRDEDQTSRIRTFQGTDRGQPVDGRAGGRLVEGAVHKSNEQGSMEGKSKMSETITKDSSRHWPAQSCSYRA